MISSISHRLIRASAGTGKTHQLTNHYLGLIAAGVAPDAILATTFTRKAAGEILDRVLERLAKAAASHGESETLALQIDRPALQPSDFIALLRRLLRQLHCMRIGTLDSFFHALAARFAAELGLPPNWTICEPAEDEVLRVETLDRLMTEAPDEVSRLFVLLTQGETRRSVHQDLMETVNQFYDDYLSSPREAWSALRIPDAVAETAELLQRLRDFDLSKCGDSRFAKTRDADADSFERGDWGSFVAKGLAARVLHGESTFYRKLIPEGIVPLYANLLRQARRELLTPIRDQAAATRQFLDRFHRQYWALKQANGGLRFNEVTHALVEANRAGALPAETLQYRLDSAIDHLLLDEFQDTALVQWRALETLARRILADSASGRSLFCVGDVKQAIYGWRGGMAAILETLPQVLPGLVSASLDENRRSAQPIIDVVNRVFGNLTKADVGEQCAPGILAWAGRFQNHTTVRETLPGYVLMAAGPAQTEEEATADVRGRHSMQVARRIADLVKKAPGRSIAVLCRKNDCVARMIYELRQVGVDASEEGGRALTDSAAVELVLSLLTLADHPGHTIAHYHVTHSPIAEAVAASPDREALSRRLRQQLHAEGHGEFVHGWAKRIAPACDARELSRLQQLVEFAYAYDARSTLRADDFVSWVRTQRVLDPSGAAVRVMTIHGAKGLQFDAVVLPELDATLSGKAPTFVVGRDPTTLEVTLVCPYLKKERQCLLSPEDQGAFRDTFKQRVDESLSLLYVAMTRAIHALYLYIPGPRKKNSTDAWHQILLQTLGDPAKWTGDTVLFRHGDEAWHAAEPQPAAKLPTTERATITFQQAQGEKRRGFERVAPSMRHAGGMIETASLFEFASGDGASIGTLYHAWFAQIDWLDDGEPADAVLSETARRIQDELAADVFRRLDAHIAAFRMILRAPAIRAVLSRRAYGRLSPHRVECERPIVARDGERLISGTIDRIVWLMEDEQIVAADILDFKTDSILDDEALEQKTAYYRPQLELYRLAVAKAAALLKDQITLRLVFTSPGAVVDL